MRFVMQTSGKCKITWKQTSANAAAGLTAANIVSATGPDSVSHNAVGAIITVETNDIRYTLDGDNDPTGSGGADFGHVLKADGGLVLDDPKQVQNFSFCSKTAGSAGVLHISSFFAKL